MFASPRQGRLVPGIVLPILTIMATRSIFGRRARPEMSYNTEPKWIQVDPSGTWPVACFYSIPKEWDFGIFWAFWAFVFVWCDTVWHFTKTSLYESIVAGLSSLLRGMFADSVDLDFTWLHQSDLRIYMYLYIYIYHESLTIISDILGSFIGFIGHDSSPLVHIGPLTFVVLRRLRCCPWPLIFLLESAYL
jgi:hypothetical protein